MSIESNGNNGPMYSHGGGSFDEVWAMQSQGSPRDRQKPQPQQEQSQGQLTQTMSQGEVHTLSIEGKKTSPMIDDHGTGRIPRGFPPK